MEFPRHKSDLVFKRWNTLGSHAYRNKSDQFSGMGNSSMTRDQWRLCDFVQSILFLSVGTVGKL
jgi:hypothetical protein